MQTTSTPNIKAGGVDQSWSAKPNTASDIINMRQVDDGFGWVNDRGFEPMIPKNTHSTILGSTADYERVFVWERHNGAECYVITKQGGELFSEVANNSGMASQAWKPHHTIAFSRSPAKSDDPGEQFVPFGRFCLILNGQDPMLKYWGRDRCENFGFTSKTPSPECLPTDSKYFDGDCDLGAIPPTSTYPYPENDTIGGLSFGVGSGTGLGSKEADSVNYYRYKVSFITDTGSESPLSEATQVNWINQVQDLTYGVFIQHVPMGPPGTVARRIYRTKNLDDLRGGGGAGELYYLVAQIDDNVSRNYLDVLPDDLLSVSAPDSFASTVISTAMKYGASWDGRVWLAGGQGTETKIIFSDQGLPEQFNAFNFFDVGNRKGGAITALFPYYDNLLIFRENSIEVVRSSGAGYICTTLNANIGTTATNAITNIQGAGVLFLSYDGIYTFEGGTLGGSRVQVKRVSDLIQQEINRISIGSLASARAAYSAREKEWWCIYPVDGQTKCTRGTVYHTLTNTWSFRHDVESKDGGAETIFNINDITTLPSGWFITAPRVTTAGPVGGVYTLYPSGIQVWSAKRSAGGALTFTVSGQGVKTITSTLQRVNYPGQWHGAWVDLGDDSIKKRIISIEIEILAQGHNEIELLSAVDYRDEDISSGSKPTVVAEQYGTILEDATYGPASGTFDVSVAKVGTSKWGENRVTRLRWDVNTGLVSWYRFTLISTNLFQLVAYHINYVYSDNKTINLKAGERKTP